jgi:alpha-tubulin suppressor-like RCC1 family protein
VALAAVLAAGCEVPTAPTQFIYADRDIVVPAGSRGWRDVTAGASHSCGIRADGALYCWGSDGSGQLGVGASRGRCGRRRLACEGGPRAAATTERFRSVQAGQRHTCAIALDAGLYCWGENLRFQTGAEGPVYVTAPARVLPGLSFLDVGPGVTHTCAVRTNGVVYCWGEGAFGALGRGDTITSVLPAPIATTERFTLVRSGRLRSCAIALDGAAWCWGLEWESTDGNVDFFQQRLLPHRIDGLPPLRDISVSSTSICGVDIEGAAWCWEANGFGQLGLGTTVGTAVPARVDTGERFTGVSAGIVQSCGTNAGGRAFCWGNNTFGQLGVPRPGEHCGGAALECSSRPIAVFGGQRFTTVRTGFGNHTCGITVDTSILCWGLGSDGQLGDGWLRDRQSLPVGVLPPAP